MIVTLTMNPTIDKSSSIDRVAAEKKLRCEAPRHEPGGGGLNVSRAIQQLGGDSLAVYPKGGPTGIMLHQLLEEESIRQEAFDIKGWVRENLIIYEESTGQQYRFGMPGPELAETEWKKALNKLDELNTKPTYVVGSGSLPPGVPDDFYCRLAKWGHKNDVRVIVDTSGEPLKLAAEEGVFLLKPNMRELKTLTGKEIRDEREQEEYAKKLVKDKKVKALAVSLGAAGALLATKDGVTRLRSPSVPIRSKVGAGDSTVGGIILALERGWEMQEAVRFGIASGAAAVMTPGTQLCRREDAEELYHRLKGDAKSDHG